MRQRTFLLVIEDAVIYTINHFIYPSTFLSRDYSETCSGFFQSLLKGVNRIFLYMGIHGVK
ncbi:hypothetical protein, partial [Serratia sp. OLIL2]|uniref:hypothetical protein n=1 Tax=Serratia sp. OLIL2 TaxID=1914913 RepID=UPI001A7E18E5